MTSLQKFEKKHMAAFEALAELTRQKKEIEKQEKALKQDLFSAMEKLNRSNGITAIDNDIVRISYIAATESVGIDMKAFLADDPDLYHEVEKKYNKRTKRSAYIKVTAK